MIKIKGFQETQRRLGSIIEGFSLEGLTNYRDMIIKNIRISCDLKEDDLLINPRSENDNITFEIGVKNGHW